MGFPRTGSGDLRRCSCVSNGLLRLFKFFKWDGVAPTKQFVVLQNYFTLLFNDKVFWTALLNNAIWLVAALLIPTSIGLGLAVLLNRGSAEAAFIGAYFTSRRFSRWRW